MDENDFLKRIRAVDDAFSGKNVPVPWRPFMAWREISGQTRLDILPRDAAHPRFERQNLMWAINDWYVEHYPKQATFQNDWGYRWLNIRGEFFRAEIPTIFYGHSLDPFRYINDLPPALYLLLTEREKSQVRENFNGFFQQASDINLNLVVWQRGTSENALCEFLDRGWADLRDAGTAFRANDPTSILFAIQQAAEKHLKALLLARKSVPSVEILRKKYGHDVKQLFESCLSLAPDLQMLEPYIDRLYYGVSVRYERTGFGAVEVVDRFNLAYSLCHLIARSLLEGAKTGKRLELQTT